MAAYLVASLLSVWATWYPKDAIEVVTVSLDDRVVTCAHGTRVTTQHTLADAPPLDVIVYPGGAGTRAHIKDGRLLDWVRARAQGGATMTSVCTGSLVYAAAGLLDGRPATSHWASLDKLAELGEGFAVRRTEGFVES
jgi:transcriptional regulator GlxA family with amidase domain